MKIIDAHIHIESKKLKPISELLRIMDENNIEKSVLIINTYEELACLILDKDNLINSLNRFHLVCGVNIYENNPFYIFDEVKGWGIKPDIKLHPLLYCYTKKDFCKIADEIAIRKKEFENIIIDTLFNDEFLDNHVGIELGIFLARKYNQKKVILAHAGSTRLLECFVYTRKIPNIYYDFSFVATYFDYTHIRLDMLNYLKYTSNRIMFGSDYPSFRPNVAITHIKELFKEAKLSTMQIENVLYNTAEFVYFKDS